MSSNSKQPPPSSKKSGGESGNEGSNEANIPTSISSDEINFLIYRYLQESGFNHSAFTFAYESLLGRSNIRNAEKSIPPGALISFLQKGLQYVGIEESLKKDGENGETNDFSLLAPHSIKALNRNNPPIKINVPPATAAAAIKARLEVEERENARQKKTTEREQRAKKKGARLQQKQQQQLMQREEQQLILEKARQQQQQQQQEEATKRKETAKQQEASSSAVPPPVVDQIQGVPPGIAAFTVQQQAQQQHQQQQQQLTEAQMTALRQQQQLMAVVAQHPEAAEALAFVNRNQNGNSVPVTNQEQPNLAAVALHLQQANNSYMQQQEAVKSMAAASVNEKEQPKPMELERLEQQDLLQQKERPYLNGMSNRDQNGAHAMGDQSNVSGLSNQKSSETQPDVNIEQDDEKTRAPASEILELNRHSSEVFMCAWNPVFTEFIATGSGDASARIWQMGGSDAKAGCSAVRELPHGTNAADKKNKDVTTLEWSSNGTLLATGSYDGVARVWTRTGVLTHTLSRHQGPIFSLKWNRSSSYLLSGSYDQTTIVWDVSGPEGLVVQQFNDHEAPALDVDWKDDATFASCSTDKRVLICRVGADRPLRVYAGHTDEVNAVKWDPSGMLLASCSDDFTAKVWDVGSDMTKPLYDFTSHKAEIYTVKWSPTGPGSRNPHKQKMLATASFDGSVRLWNIDDGSCLRVFSRHHEAVYSVAFSPSGDYLASGSLAGQLYIWSISHGVHIKSFKGKGDIFEVAWNVEESRVAACFSSNVVSVIDFKKS